MPAISWVGHVKKNAVRKIAVTILMIKKYKDNLSGRGFLYDANRAPTKLNLIISSLYYIHTYQA